MAELQSLDKQQLRKLLTAAMDNNPRDHLMILIAYCHGLRVSELVNLTNKNIDCDGGYITVKRLKGSLKTTQELWESEDLLFDAKKRVTEYARNIQGRLFPMTRFGFYAIMRKYGKKIGLPMHKCHPHVLKHSIGTHMIEQIGIHKLRQYLGHKNINSTGAYIRVSDEQACEAVKDVRNKIMKGIL